MSELGELPPDAVNIGGDHWMVLASYKGEAAGVQEFHRNAAGHWCSGWVSFRGSPWERSFSAVGVDIKPWDVISTSPLTLSPSIKCRACGNHGYIEGGVWREA